jgi:8-oxo-dGTP pyrophosphatase MutT (NUDIX family)
MTTLLERLEEELAQYEPSSGWDVGGRVATGVCVPIAESEGDVDTLVIRRPDSLRDHAGEMGFPGGKREPDDLDLGATAVREAAEELGIPRSAFRIVGSLTPIGVATSKFAIYPYVAVIAPAQELRPAKDEVAEVIRAALAAFLDGRISYEAVDMGVYRSPIFGFPAGRLYGASAHVLLELLTLFAKVRGVTIPEPGMVDVPPWNRSPNP